MRFRFFAFSSLVKVRCWQGIWSKANWPIPVPSSFSKRQIDVIAISKFEIQKLNAKFRRVNEPTDVLSFYYGEGVLLGEVYLCLEEVANKAKMFNNDFRAELVLDIVHGVLHVVGFKHSAEMFSRQQQLADKLIKEINEADCWIR